MKDYYSNFYKEENLDSPLGFEETDDSNYVDQMEEEDQLV